MTAYNNAGDVLHHKDCTYCIHHRDINIGTKSRKKIQERCEISGDILPPPHDIRRFCEQYQQKGCDCPECRRELHGGFF